MTAEQRAVFALLDRFDPFDTSKLPFGRVAIGYTFARGRGPWQNTYRHGFLLGSTGRNFSVRYIGLGKATLKATPRGTPPSQRIAFEPVDLREYARRFAKMAAARRKEERDNPRRSRSRWGFYLSPQTPTNPTTLHLLLARACARRGLDAEVHALWAALPDDARSADSFTRKFGNHQLARALSSRLTLDFRDGGYTWKDLLDRHDLWLDTFPNYYHTESVQGDRDAIRAVLDLEKKRASAKPSMETLVLDLRNERFPASVPMFSARNHAPEEPRPKDGTRPMDRLRQAGLRAVPALLAAREDPTYTRSIYYSSRFGGGFGVITLGRLVDQALAEIAGVRAEDWKKWYAEAQRIGIKRALANRIDLSMGHGIDAATSYLERWPAEFEVVLAAMQKATGAKEQYYLFRLIDELGEKAKDPRVVRLLEGMLTRAQPGSRLHAAEALLGHGNRKGIPVVLRTWQQAPQPKTTGDGHPGSEESTRLLLLPFLAKCGDPSALRTLTSALSAPPVRDRYLEVLRGSTLASMVHHAKATQRDELERTLQASLIDLLGFDTPSRWAAEFHAGHDTGAATMHRSSDAELAACALATYWPRVYAFEPRATGSVRRQQLARLRNAHCKGPARPLPKLAPPVPTPAPAAGALLQNIRAGASSWQSDLTELERLGPPALPPLLAALRDHPTTHRTHTPLAATARRLSNRINAVRFDSSAEKMSPPVRKRCLAMRGKRATPKELLQLMLAVCLEAKKQQRAGRVHLERTGRGGGASLRIEFAREPSEGEGSSFDCAITVDGRQLTGGSWSATQGKIDSIGSFDQFGCLASLRDAFDAPAGKGVEITLTLQHH